MIMVTMQNETRIPRFNLLYKSLHGAYLEVIEAENITLIGLSGFIVNETRYTIVIRTKENIEKMIEKKGCLFRITLPGIAPTVIHGRYLLGRLDERIKKHTRRI